VCINDRHNNFGSKTEEEGTSSEICIGSKSTDADAAREYQHRYLFRIENVVRNPQRHNHNIKTKAKYKMAEQHSSKTSGLHNTANIMRAKIE
jgi:hypothetical protein